MESLGCLLFFALFIFLTSHGGEFADALINFLNRGCS